MKANCKLSEEYGTSMRMQGFANNIVRQPGIGSNPLLSVWRHHSVVVLYFNMSCPLPNSLRSLSASHSNGLPARLHCCGFCHLQIHSSTDFHGSMKNSCTKTLHMLIHMLQFLILPSRKLSKGPRVVADERALDIRDRITASPETILMPSLLYLQGKHPRSNVFVTFFKRPTQMTTSDL